MEYVIHRGGIQFHFAPRPWLPASREIHASELVEEEEGEGKVFHNFYTCSETTAIVLGISHADSAPSTIAKKDIWEEKLNFSATFAFYQTHNDVIHASLFICKFLSPFSNISLK